MKKTNLKNVLTLLLLLVIFLGVGKSYADSLNVRQVALLPAFGVEDVKLQGDYAFLAPAMSIVHIIRPDSLQLVNYTNFGGGYHLAVSGNYAYETNTALKIINFTNMDSPFVAGVCSYPDTGEYWYRAFDVAVSGNYAYIAGGDSGLHIADISDPSSPQLVGYCHLPNTAMAVTVSGNYAYVADYTSSLRIIDISNPLLPHEIGHYQTIGGGMAQCIALSGNYVYYGEEFGIFHVINVSNPMLPQQVSTFYSFTNITGIAVSENFAYVVFEWGKLSVLDVSNPASPFEVGYYDLPSSSGIGGISVRDNYAYVAEDGYLGVYDCSGATSSVVKEMHDVVPKMFSLKPAYPNPFNPTTTISFSLPKSSPVHLTIYDALGRQVTTLLSEHTMTAGNHSVSWNAQQYATGVYFCRMDAGGFTSTKKLMLLK